MVVVYLILTTRLDSTFRILMDMSERSEKIREESLWFGETEHPLFGRVTVPAGGTSRGGVLISPPIGRESRLARRALRTLAIYLANDGYVSLRFDHFGTGDSGGSMDDNELDRVWVEGIDQGVELLRSFGIDSISAIGMRMGAAILGTAALKYDLGLSSLVLWDPCESGRAYARELVALGALRQDTFVSELDEATQMLEYALSESAAIRLNEFNLMEPAARSVAERVLVVVRDDRALSSRFRARWSEDEVEWTSTSEQGPLLEAQLPNSIQPELTIAEIRSWLTSPEVIEASLSLPPFPQDVIVTKGSNSFSVRETVVDLGFRKMFGIISEPVGAPQGPLIVMVNGVNEDHVGPARLWVELSRRWASLGLRCLRFDSSELGESPWTPDQVTRFVWNKSRYQDIGDAVRALSPADPGDSVLVGYCSGAGLALEVASGLRTRGVCAINPELGAGVFRSFSRMRKSNREAVRSVVNQVEGQLTRYPWLDKLIRRGTHLMVTSLYPPKISPTLIKNRSETLLVLSPEDLSPLRQIPMFGWIFRLRLVPSEYLHIEIVPGLDHAILSTLGRSRAVSILDRHVVTKFVASQASETNQFPGAT
jgi:pimeloyl-ACP methyl ester carboxylesterase